MRNHAAEHDPARNPNFSRRWRDDPLQLPDLQHLGREITPMVIEDVGRRAISRWLDRASGGHGAVAATAFRRADAIRQELGIEWSNLIKRRNAA